MNDKAEHAQKDSPRGIFYQVLVAIKYAISEPDVLSFDRLSLEDTGDISFDTIYQVETKHHKSAHSLGDKHEDFWKTIYNWFPQKDEFNKFILHTTSHFPKKSMLKDWNDNSVEENVQILKDIDFDYKLGDFEKYKLSKINNAIIENKGISRSVIEQIGSKKYTKDEFEQLIVTLNITKDDQEILFNECKDTSLKKFSSWNYSRYLNSCDETKLSNLVKKVIIRTDQEVDTDLINTISSLPIFRGICQSVTDYRLLIKDRIAGVIASKVEGDHKWEVTNRQFYEITKSASATFFNDIYRPVFDKYLSKTPSEEEIGKTSKKKFVGELEKIKCKHKESRMAIVDYWKTNALISEELESNPFFVDNEYIPYQLNVVAAQALNEKMKYDKVDDEDENLKNSLRFYQTAKSLNFKDTKVIKSFHYFTHGTLHNLIEDENIDFKWVIDD